MRILVIRPGALGDVLLTLPALQALSSAFPQAAIELMGNLSVLDWLPGRSVVRSVSSFDRADLAALFRPEAEPAASVQAYLDSFDLILSYATAPEHAFARNLSRLARGRVLTLDARPEHVSMHMSAYLQQPLRELGIAPGTDYPALHLTPADRQAAASWWSEHHLPDRGVAAIHPGSGSPAKNWPAERFAALAGHLQRGRGAHVLVLAGPADDAALDGVRRAVSGAALPPRGQAPLALQNLPLPLLAAILSRCQLYVGNDSGVSHLAAAVGVPTVAIFGPTDPGVWAPRGPAVRIVRAPVPCAPCPPPQRQSCPQRACLDSVPVQTLLEAVATLADHPVRPMRGERRMGP